MLKEIRPVLVNDDRYITSKPERIPFCFASRPGHSFGILKKGEKKVMNRKKDILGFLGNSCFLNQHSRGNRNGKWIYLYRHLKVITELVGVILPLFANRVPSLGFGPERVTVNCIMY